MSKVSRTLVNEFGETTTIEVTYLRSAMTVSITTEGKRMSDELLTPRERIVLRELLAPENVIEPAYKAA